ncbi:MAG TPA: DNA-binding response regulator [Prolixibacteraceae bacterium]|nr:DNA-binding response regulator [Prolixibacteraceae bacterium]
MNERKIHILLAEDDLNLGFLLTEFLESHGYQVKLYRDGESALKGFKSVGFNFCILDVMLPKMDGFTLARNIKDLMPGIPVIFLTARSMKADKLRGYDLGADDYITKPFDEDELLCRIKAVMNRTDLDISNNQTYRIGKYEFDMENLALKIGDEIRRLTSREAEVLHLLCNSKNNIVKREQLLTSIWGENDYFAGRSLDVFISKLRKYFAADPTVRIENIPKVGFLLSCSDN